MPFDLLAATVLKALAELGGLFLIGRWIVGALASMTRQPPERNVVYQLFVVITKPLIVATRAITPRAIVDRHIPLVAFLILAWLYVVSAGWKISLCGTYGPHDYTACHPYATKRQ